MRNVIFQYGECTLWIDTNLQFAQAYFWRNTKSSLYFSLLVGIWFLIYFQLFIYSLKSKSFVCGWCGGTNGRWTPAFLPAPLARDSVSHQNNICNFNKYILQFQQIHFAISTNTFAISTNTFAISTNTFCNFNKYNTRFGKSAPKHKSKRASKLQILHIQKLKRPLWKSINDWVIPDDQSSSDH